jgi:DNA-binding XRE family transcriptional regulator
LQLKLPTDRDVALSDPLIDGLRSGADGAGNRDLASEESNSVVGGHGRDFTLVASALQLISSPLRTDNREIRFRLVGVEFSERLLRARNATQKTQEQVAHACGLSHAAISKAEAGKTETMGSQNLFAIADFLGCDARWLATGEGEMHPRPSELETLTPAQREVVLSVIKSMK